MKTIYIIFGAGLIAGCSKPVASANSEVYTNTVAKEIQVQEASAEIGYYYAKAEEAERKGEAIGVTNALTANYSVEGLSNMVVKGFYDKPEDILKKFSQQ